jgi:hypothetical protein
MGPPPPGFRLVLDVVPFDGAWVVVPGLLALLACVGLLLLRRVVPPGWPAAGRLLAACALALFLGAVWWTLGGVGAWRAGAGRLDNGTADFVEGTLEAPVRARGGALVGFRVGTQPFHRATDACLPALHATRWPTVRLLPGQRVRAWFFGEDVLRLEVMDGADSGAQPAP